MRGLAIFCAVMGMDGQAGLLVHQEDVFHPRKQCAAWEMSR